MKKISEHKSILQFIKFGLVGVSNTIVSYSVYAVCCFIIGTNVHVANVAGFIISVFWAFIMQSKFVFKETEEGEHRVWWQVLIKTYIAYSFTGLFLTEVLLILWLQIIDISRFLTPVVNWLFSNFGKIINEVDLAKAMAPFLNMVFTIPINFCVNKFWAYRQKKSNNE